MGGGQHMLYILCRNPAPIIEEFVTPEKEQERDRKAHNLDSIQHSRHAGLGCSKVKAHGTTSRHASRSGPSALQHQADPKESNLRRKRSAAKSGRQHGKSQIGVHKKLSGASNVHREAPLRVFIRGEGPSLQRPLSFRQSGTSQRVYPVTNINSAVLMDSQQHQRVASQCAAIHPSVLTGLHAATMAYRGHAGGVHTSVHSLYRNSHVNHF